MPGRIYLANVGANAGHGFAGPIFADGSFEFIPIPEDRDLIGDHAVRYRDLRAYNDPSSDLLRYVPRRLWDWPTHNDPEFDTYTYGDNCETSPRAAALKTLARGDFLFFLSRLERWNNGRPGGTAGFYLVGYLEIEESIGKVTSRPDDATLRRIGNNAHVRRGLSHLDLWDRFWVFRGSGRSRRFRKAVPLTRNEASRLFVSADGTAWRWSTGRTDLQVIGSYTRSCRCVMDPALPGHQGRAEALWELVAHNAG